MPIKRLTPNSAIAAHLEAQIKRREDAIIYNLSYVGEQCVAEARTAGSYTDRTGNLRGSTGYVIIKDGQILRSGGFEPVNGTENGSRGIKDGPTFARSLATEYPHGIVLIVVAGMKYAAYVSAKGYNVLDSAELLAQKIVPQMLAQLGIG